MATRLPGTDGIRNTPNAPGGLPRARWVSSVIGYSPCVSFFAKSERQTRVCSKCESSERIRRRQRDNSVTREPVSVQFVGQPIMLSSQRGLQARPCGEPIIPGSKVTGIGREEARALPMPIIYKRVQALAARCVPI